MCGAGGSPGCSGLCYPVMRTGNAGTRSYEKMSAPAVSRLRAVSATPRSSRTEPVSAMSKAQRKFDMQNPFAPVRRTDEKRPELALLLIALAAGISMAGWWLGVLAWAVNG